MANPVKYKTFNGKRYTLWNRGSSRAKSIANTFAKIERRKGNRARVVEYLDEGKKYYSVYVRNK